MVLECQNISKSFGAEEVIRKASFMIEDNEKAALVGSNGAGKTTLLRILMQEIPAGSGMVVIAKGKSLGYLPQNPTLKSNRSIYDEVLFAKPEDTYDSWVAGILKGLGFSEGEFGKRMQELSGGQRTRVFLGKLLITKPDILLLDEPTNHLDIGSVTWLEKFLSNYRGAILLVSHDRYFLDRVVDKVIDLDSGLTQTYSGNYSDYAKKKAEARAALIRQYFNQQKEIKHQEEVIAKLKSFNREKSIRRAESREKLLNKMERLEKPVEEAADMKLELEPRIRSGNDVLQAEDVSKSFPGQRLFSNISFSIRRGERVALIGDNGTGKTTLLKIINRMVEADSGAIILGANVHVGYYDQAHQVLHMDKTLIEEISDAYPSLNNTQIRNVLAAFLFTGDEVFKQIGDLSGGERGRLSLAKLMLSEANFLILDEPTNHLDVVSKEILEQALSAYTGTVLFVSHDRYFINRSATRILDLRNESLTNYLGNYDYYLEKKARSPIPLYGGVPKGRGGPREALPTGQGSEKRPKSEEVEQAANASDGKAQWQQKKNEQARERKLANDLKKAEDRIEETEGLIRELEEKMSDSAIATNPEELERLHHIYEEEKQKLEDLFEIWESLC